MSLVLTLLASSDATGCVHCRFGVFLRFLVYVVSKRDMFSRDVGFQVCKKPILGVEEGKS